MHSLNICFKFVFFLRFHIKVNFRFCFSLTESLRKCPCYKCEAKEEALKAAQDTAEAVDNETDDDEYLEYLCNINYGITLQELRALEER